ncbi:DUF11 domain-containing protein [Aurantiacibacter aquimixticola]|uniref:DUF11 domain-containing protein n=1 Tax=Aurantiacibacter aquimixticola TaxID=1958945 RepID=UPI001401BFC9|nr:DUF11 domain-containing protein [Aurantiacibacter aquimixticola]
MLGLMRPDLATAQSTATVDWTTLGAPSTGALPNPSTATASDGTTTATVRYSTVANGTPFVPLLDTFVSYYDPSFGGFAGTLLMNFDNSTYDPGDKLTTEITLNRSVTGLQFILTDIDTSSWVDAVEVFYDNGDGTWRNVAETASFYTAGSAATRTNNATVNGWRGTANVAASQTTGNIAFSFGTTLVKRVRIVYFSYTGTGDPGGQVSGISDLTFNRAFADLSLTKLLLTPSPTNGSAATFRLTLNNAASSSLSATGVRVRDTLPAGFAYTSSTGTGTFDPATGIWNVGTLARNQNVSMEITGTVNATSGAVLTNRAEVSASDQADPDSTPNNGVTSEDDFASATLAVGGTRAAGTPPALFCPNQSIVFDWDNVNWIRGSLNNTYALGSLGNISFSITNQGTFVAKADYGGDIPGLSSTINGGLAGGGRSLVYHTNMPDRASEATTTIALPDVMRGAQFQVFDIDSSGSFADRVQVEGRLQGATVQPVLTNGSANYIVGNEARGDGSSSDTQANGNITVTFSQPIDTIIIRYGNHAAAPADPGNQGVALHDITFCRPTTTLTVDKTSRLLSDPVDIGDTDFHIPGAIVEYCLVTSNTGQSRATDIRMNDVIPPQMTYVPGSIRSGATCSGAKTVEDDDAAGADESDPVGAQFLSSGEVRASAAQLSPGASIAIIFRTQIN